MSARSLVRTLEAPVDAASLAAYRVAFGVLMAGSAIRFLAAGWVDRCFVEPKFFFPYYGFSFVHVLPRAWMIGAFVLLAVLGVLVALGLFYRFAIVAFLLVFTYVELIDVTNYLNHYYLVSLLAFLLALVPAHACFSLDARLGFVERSATVPRFVLSALRFQVGVVYVYAALAKVESDWLLHGQPLQIWMGSHTDFPIVGPYLARHDVAVAMSWAGFSNDLLAVPLLLFPRTRALAFALLVVFHGATSLFFNIGIFPILMPINATLFFEPDWPRRVAEKLGVARTALEPSIARPRLSPLLAAILGIHLLVQLVLPLRTRLYGGNVLWHEQGMRFSWRVMLRKKTGSIRYRVRSASLPHEIHVSPRRYLNDAQEREFEGQPDLILVLAHRIADDFRAHGHRDVAVYVDAWVSLNGRPPSRMIDPDANLARIANGLAPARHILPAPLGPPARLGH